MSTVNFMPDIIVKTSRTAAMNNTQITYTNVSHVAYGELQIIENQDTGTRRLSYIRDGVVRKGSSQEEQNVVTYMMVFSENLLDDT